MKIDVDHSTLFQLQPLEQQLLDKVIQFFARGRGLQPLMYILQLKSLIKIYPGLESKKTTNIYSENLIRAL
jgi:hypothetical protein